MTARLGDRALFPDLAFRSFLAHCAVSPPSLPVRAAVRDVLDRTARDGHVAVPAAMAEREALRAALAALVGASPDEIGLAPNTSTGVVTVAFGLDWKAGDRVVVFDGEFPANVTPWQQAAATFGLGVVRLPIPTGGDLGALEGALKGGVRLVAVSQVQFQTGLAMPLAEMGALCRRYGAELFVDAIQGVGCVPLDVEAAGVDYLACGGHKWLMGVEGTGFLYVRRSRPLVPRLAGWLSHDSPVDFLLGGPGLLRYDKPLRTRADMVEGGVQNAAGQAGLLAAVRILHELGVERIFAHVQRLHDAIEPLFVERGYTSLRSPSVAGRSGILAFRPPPGIAASSVPPLLRARGVGLTAPDGCVRVAPHWPNSALEIEVLGAALTDP